VWKYCVFDGGIVDVAGRCSRIACGDRCAVCLSWSVVAVVVLHGSLPLRRVDMEVIRGETEGY
jgi:hypothetical protein